MKIQTPKEMYPHLLSPISLGPITLSNRAVVPSHSMGFTTERGTVGERYIEYLRERAIGGAAMIGMGSAPVHKRTKFNIMHPWMWEDYVVESLAKAADSVQSAGSHLCMMLWHAGHNVSHFEGSRAIGPSAVPAPLIAEVPKVMNKKDIREVVDSYRTAARRCVEAGLHAIEIQTSSDYLLGSFLSPRLNRRSDEYGGSVENRCRIIIEVLEAVREEAGSNIAVGVRTSAAHLIPTDPDGYGVEDSLAAMKHLDSHALVDWVNIMTASHWNFPAMISPMHYPRLQIVDIAAQFKKDLSVPVIVAGRIRSPEEAEDVIAAGKTDIIAMARSFIAEPHWMRKVMSGNREQIRPCMSCNQACLGFAFRQIPSSCVINPRAGREFELEEPQPTTMPKEISIIGAGPAGLECARVAAVRGHNVTLYEAQDRLGGDMRLAADSPNRSEMRGALDWWESELIRLGVEIRTGERVENPESLDADTVVWAIGAQTAITGVWRNRPQLYDGIPGTANCPHGRDILSQKKSVSGNVLIISEENGWPSVSVTETIATQANVSSVTVTTDQTVLGLPDLQFTGEIGDITARLDKAGVTVHTTTLIASVENGMATTLGGQSLGPFESIVLCTGTVGTEIPDGVTPIGDCVSPKSIWAAVTEGTELGRTL